jgi:hypothetical protein
MHKSLLFFYCFWCIAFPILGFGQIDGLTGSWEGLMEDEYIRFDMVQQGEKLCGYSYDIVLKNKKSHCTAYFEGRYIPEKKYWLLTGKKFIENSGDHILMSIRVWNPLPGKKNILRGALIQESLLSMLLENDIRDMFWLRKKSDQPKSPTTTLPVCYMNPNDLKINQKKDPLFSVKTTIKNQHKSNPMVVNPTQKTTVSKTDSNQIKNRKKIINPNRIEPDKPEIEKEIETDPIYFSMIQRKSTVISSIDVPEQNVQIKLYDNGTVDNDSVSVFYNGKLLTKNQRLSEQAIIIDLTLEKNVKSHEIILFAENLGIYPPNTATIILTSGKKRYELRSSASFDNNAKFTLNYDPTLP